MKNKAKSWVSMSVSVCVYACFFFFVTNNQVQIIGELHSGHVNTIEESM